MTLNRSHPLAKGLVGCWVFNECTGETVFDLSGNGNNGTITGADWCADGLDFSNDYISIPSLDFNANTKDYTLVISFSRDKSTTYEYLFDQRDANDDGFNLRFVNGYIWSQLNGYDAKSSSTITDTNTHQAAASMDRDGNGQIYIDGVADGTSVALNSEAMSITSGLCIGKSTFEPDFFDGQIYYAYIYNRALAASEVAELNADPYQMFKRAINPALFYYESIGGMNIPIFINHYTQQMRV